MAKQIKIQKIEIFETNLNFKQKFKHSLKTRNQTTNIILKIHSKENFGLGESIPREYLTGETPKSVIKTLQNKIIPHFQNQTFKTKKSLLKQLWEYRQTLKKNEISAFSAFEIALLHLAAKQINLTIEDIFKYFKLKPQKQKTIQYSAVIGESNLLKMLIKAYIIKKRNFKQVKIKTSQKTLYKLKYLSKILKNQQIRIDANCGLNQNPTQFEKTTQYLSKHNINLIEQPFPIQNQKNKQILNQNLKIANKSKIQIILDEDLIELKDLEKINPKNINNKKTPQIGNIPNLRPTKIGGIMTTIYMQKICEQNKTQTIIACLVGETILTKINKILNFNIKTLSKEGNYDQFLFKNSIIKNKPFQKNGLLKEKINLNYSNSLQTNIKSKIIKKITIK